ncbi:hypothetical protein HMPREF1275_00919 [Propionibacterium sp. KPL1844]|nr:hypothetical protein HMPREF1275_00919 [Propionibacterium sp. KPL1844]
MTSDVTPRVMIERNLAMSLMMQIDGADLATVATKLPTYQLADTMEERAETSTQRIMAVLGLAPDN